RQIAMEPEELQPQTPAVPPSSSEQSWLASHLLQRQVVNATTLEPIGRVADVAFNPETCRVTALVIERTPTGGEVATAVRRAFGQHRTIASVGLDHVIALNGDVVTTDRDPVQSAVVPSKGPGQVACLCDVCDLTIITLHGICLGSLADVLL